MRSLACCSGRWKCGARRGDHGDQLDDRRRAVHRLERAHAEKHVIVNVGQGREKLEKARGRRQIAAIRAEVHAGNRDLPEPGRDGPLDLVEDACQRRAPPAAARRRDDAVAARLVAAGLNAQRPRRAPGDARCERRAARSVAEVKPELSATSRSLSSLRTTCRTLGSARQSSATSRGVAAGRDDLRCGIRRATRRIVWRAP